MKSKARPFWKILIVAAEHDAKATFNCDECFAILEYLAEVAVKGAEERYLLEAVGRHLDCCPDCREHHLQRLKELEAKLDSRRSSQ